MRGYCETCTQVVDSVDEAHGADVCPTCGDDVHPGFSIDGGNAYEEDDAEYDVDQWLADQ